MTNSRRFRRVLLLLALLTLLIGLWGTFLRTHVPDAAETERLLAETLSAKSYCYTLQAEVMVDGASRDYFTLRGEKNGDDAHVSGTVLGSSLELYWVEGMIYRRSGDEDWQVLPEAQIEHAAALFAELLPAASFAYHRITDYRSDGLIETEDGEKLQLVLAPEADGWVAEYFTAVEYILLLDKRGRQLQELQLQATSRTESEALLHLRASFSDLGEEIRILPPL